MDDQEFLDQVKQKIERLTGREIVLHIDHDDTSKLEVDNGASIPEVVVGSKLLQYSGFARMAVEYAVASIKEGREIQPLEFQLLLSRN